MVGVLTTTSGKHGVPDRPTRPLVYLDSCVYLDLVTRNATADPDTGQARWQSSQTLLDAVNAEQIILASSPLVQAEVTCHGSTRAGHDDIRRQLTGWFTAPSTVWTEIDRHLARESVRVMDQFRSLAAGDKKMAAADALHLAAAIRLRADFLMTHDAGFPLGHVVDAVDVGRPRVVWQEPLPLTSP